eukprot:358949-Chlamydomonas_euryale.AAC.1
MPPMRKYKPRGQFPLGRRRGGEVCPKSLGVAQFPGPFILLRLVFQNVSIVPTLPRARLFDNLAVLKAARKKLRGTWPAWRRRLASEAPGNARDHLESCPRGFQTSLTVPEFGQRQYKLTAWEFLWTSGDRRAQPNGSSPIDARDTREYMCKCGMCRNCVQVSNMGMTHCPDGREIQECCKVLNFNSPRRC